MFPDSHRASFPASERLSLDIEVLAWVLAADFHVFTATAEELNFAIARIVEQAGTSFAFPSQTLYLGRETRHPERSARAEVAHAEVAAAPRAWRARGARAGAGPGRGAPA